MSVLRTAYGSVPDVTRRSSQSLFLFNVEHQEAIEMFGKTKMEDLDLGMQTLSQRMLATEKSIDSLRKGCADAIYNLKVDLQQQDRTLTNLSKDAAAQALKAIEPRVKAVETEALQKVEHLKKDAQEKVEGSIAAMYKKVNKVPPGTKNIQVMDDLEIYTRNTPDLCLHSVVVRDKLRCLSVDKPLLSKLNLALDAVVLQKASKESFLKALFEVRHDTEFPMSKEDLSDIHKLQEQLSVLQSKVQSLKTATDSATIKTAEIDSKLDFVLETLDQLNSSQDTDTTGSTSKPIDSKAGKDKQDLYEDDDTENEDS
ncbi:MAG: hypothetical protein V1837_04995 [Candidatus Woesearchaeota archaeon]